MIRVSKEAHHIISILDDNDFATFIVGGYVRDSIMGTEPSDLDLATLARPDDIKNIFSTYPQYKIIETGLKYGTLTIFSSLSRESYEITTFRKDINHTGRHSDIEFSDYIEDDLSRRDFTINAMAYDLNNDVLIDPFGGQDDITSKTIKCVGQASQRFTEDNLRMLRAIRFATNFDYTIDSDTYRAIEKNIEGINRISIERIKIEIDKCFSKACEPSRFFEHLRLTGMLRYIFPEMLKMINFKQNQHHMYDVYHHTLKTIDAVPKEYPLVRWSALFHDFGKPDTCENYGTMAASFHRHEKVSEVMSNKIMKRLKFSNDDRYFISMLVSNHLFLINEATTDRSLRRLMRRMGLDNLSEKLETLFILRIADVIGNGKKDVKIYKNKIDNIKLRCDKIMENQNAISLKDLDINGDDIMTRYGIEPSPKVGEYLELLLEKIINNPELNNKKSLFRIIEKHIK